MIRQRRASAAAPTAPSPPAGAEAWIEFMRRQAEQALPPGLLPPGTGLAAARNAALRSGDYAVTEPATGL